MAYTLKGQQALLAARKARLSQVTASLAFYQKMKDDAVKNGTPLAGTQKKVVELKITSLTTQRARLYKEINTIGARIATLTPPSASLKPGDAGFIGPAADPVPTPDGMAKINLSACRELYFRTGQKFLSDTVGGTNNVPNGHIETTSYKRAKELWSKGQASKGVFQTWDYPKSGVTDSSATLTDQLIRTNKYPGKHAFQFHYNPGSISMGYEGFPDVDISMYVAQPPKVAAYGVAGSTISFSLLINRMPDMKYIDPAQKDYKRRVKGRVPDYKRDIYNRDPYIDKTTGRNELKDIYNKGTMYDIDHFMRVMMGFTLASALRGGEFTSDIGWLNPQPIELHLGAGLRYLVSVTSLNIEHVIFNERMVPLFSTIQITASRIPDWGASDKTTKDGNWE